MSMYVIRPPTTKKNRRLLRRIACIAIVTLSACGSPQTSHATAPRAKSDVQYGKATWYGKEQQGGPTASGERFDRNKLTAAHRSLPLGTIVRVTNERNGKSVLVRINDRGPYGGGGRVIDLSEAAAREIGIIDAGVANVRIEIQRRPGPAPRRNEI